MSDVDPIAQPSGLPEASDLEDSYTAMSQLDWRAKLRDVAKAINVQLMDATPLEVIAPAWIPSASRHW